MRWRSLLIGLISYIKITLGAEICEGVVGDEFLVDPESCDHFYYCEDGNKPVLSMCPSGMLFNPQIHLCDLPEHVTCGSSTVAPTSTEGGKQDLTTTKPTTTFATNSNPPSTTSIPSTTPHTNDEDVKCPTGSSNTVQFVRSRRSCQVYFICYQGRAFKQECLPELHWKDSTKKCELPERAKCQLETPEESSCPPHGEAFYAHPTDCNQFVYCIDGIKIPQKCSFFFHFDIVRKRCILMTQANCILDNKDN